MIGALLALSLAATPKVFLSVDHAFLPDAPGAVVRAELEGASTLDVRLYQLRDPEHFLGGSDELSSLVAAPPPGAPRAPSPPAVLARGAVGLRHQLHADVEPLLTDAAQAALQLLAPGSLVDAPHELPFLRGEPVLRRWTLPCGGAEAHHYCDVDLGPLPSGVYLVEGVAGAQAGYAVALVSRLALAARHLPGQLVLLAADARTGEGRPAVQVPLSGPSLPAQHGVTGANGALQLKLAGRTTRALAHAGNDWAVLDLPAAPARTRGPRLWLAPTRGEARPGEHVRFWGAERPPPPAARDLNVSLEDGRGTVVATGLARQDAQGLLSGELILPDEAASGLGHLVADVEGRPVAGELWIRDPPRPDVTATATLEATGEKAVALIDARDGAGAPLPADVEWRLLRTPLEGTDDAPALTEVVDEGEAHASAEGQARVELDLPSGPDARFTLDAAAIDGWGHRAPCSASAVELRGPVHVVLQPDRRVYAPGETALVSVRASDAEGRPAAARLTVRSTAVRLGASGEASTAAPTSIAVEVPASGSASLAIPVPQAGYEELEALSGSTRLAEAVLFASAKGGDIPFTPDALTLVADRAAYAPGETARLLVFAPFESGTALLTIESGEQLRAEVVAIHGGSALLSHKVAPGASGLTVSATAVLNGQSYLATRTVRVGAPEPVRLEATLGPAARPDALELQVRAHDAAGKPLAGVVPLCSWHAAAALPSLAPPLQGFLEPEPAAEGRTDVSLEFRSAGQSASAHRTRVAPVGPAAFTPQKGLGAVAARAPHATLDRLERLPPTDRSGTTHLLLSVGDARAVTAEVLAAFPSADPHGPPALLMAQASRDGLGITAVPRMPRTLRANDRALASVELFNPGSAGSAALDGRALAVPAAGSVLATLSVDPAHPEYRVESAGRQVLVGRVPVVSGEEWVTVQAGEAPAGTLRLASEGEEGTLRLRVLSGPRGLLRLLADSRRTPGAAADYELLQPSAAPRPEADARLAALATAVAANGLRPDPSALGAAAAAVVAQLEPTGELGAFPGAPYDRGRTALALWLLGQAQALGAGVPAEWLERVRSQLQSDPAKGPDAALRALALGGPLPLLDGASLDALGPAPLAALTLLAAERRDPRADDLATRLEKRAGASGNRACWADDGCDPRTPATVQALTDTAWAALALAAVRPKAPRVAGALRYLVATREQAVWGRGASGVLLPLALAAGDAALPDRSATVHLAASGAGAEAQVTPGSSALLYASGGPATLRVRGGPIFYELARARAEPAGASGELRVERRMFRVVHGADKLEREALHGHVPRGAEVVVELTITGAASHEVLQVEDRYPAGLEPVAQPGRSDPASDLLERGGSVTYLGNRVHLDVVTGDAPATVVAYLARAALAGHFVAPPAIAVAGELSGRSAQDELEIQSSAEGDP